MTETLFINSALVPFYQLILAMILGMVLGMERNIAGKRAGMRTYAMVSVASCLLIIVASLVTEEFVGISNFDPLRTVSGIITGIGFIGAGIIIFRDSTTLEGLTTAAGLWISAVIGITVGYGFYLIATFATFLALFIFTVLWFFEEWTEERFRILFKKR